MFRGVMEWGGRDMWEKREGVGVRKKRRRKIGGVGMREGIYVGKERGRWGEERRRRKIGGGGMREGMWEKREGVGVRKKDGGK
jgi:hypothetical protein